MTQSQDVLLRMKRDVANKAIDLITLLNTINDIDFANIIKQDVILGNRQHLEELRVKIG